MTPSLIDLLHLTRTGELFCVDLLDCFVYDSVYDLLIKIITTPNSNITTP